MYEKITLEKAATLIKIIRNDPIRKSEFRKHVAYYAKLKRKGIITEKQCIETYDSLLVTFAR